MRKQIVGKVISAKMMRTRVVVTEVLRKHPLYKKYFKHKTKFYVDDKNENSKEGDLVLIEETRPLSKLKKWRLVKILKKAEEK